MQCSLLVMARQAVGLEEKADCAASTLSGGSKRKLQVGIALLADSRVVLLDEPSSGVERPSDSFDLITVANCIRHAGG